MPSSYLWWLSEMRIAKMSISYGFTRWKFIRYQFLTEFQASRDSVQIRPCYPFRLCVIYETRLCIPKVMAFWEWHYKFIDLHIRSPVDSLS